MGMGNFQGEGRPIVKHWDTLRSSAKKAVPIEMPIGLWARMGPRKHVSDGSPNPHMERGNFGEGHPL